MADVLFLCVQADASIAEDLADVFEGAGFSIEEGAVNERSIAASAVCVIVWSRTATTSNAFNRAMTSAIAANKALVARVDAADDGAPAAPAFDISGWAGDADDPLLDDLFSAVDAMAPIIETPEQAHEQVHEQVHEQAHPAPAEPDLPKPVVKLVATREPPTLIAKAKIASSKKKQRKAYAEFDPLSLKRERPPLRLVHGALAALLIGGAAFTADLTGRFAAPAASRAEVSVAPVSLVPGAQSFTMDDLFGAQPLPPMPTPEAGVGPAAFASPDTEGDVAPQRPTRRSRPAIAEASPTLAPVSFESERKVEALTQPVFTPPTSEPSDTLLAAVAYTPAAEPANKPSAKPHV